MGIKEIEIVKSEFDKISNYKGKLNYLLTHLPINHFKYKSRADIDRSENDYLKVIQIEKIEFNVFPKNKEEENEFELFRKKAFEKYNTSSLDYYLQYDCTDIKVLLKLFSDEYDKQGNKFLFLMNQLKKIKVLKPRPMFYNIDRVIDFPSWLKQYNYIISGNKPEIINITDDYDILNISMAIGQVMAQYEIYLEEKKLSINKSNKEVKKMLFEEIFKDKNDFEKILNILISNKIISKTFNWIGITKKKSEITVLVTELQNKGYTKTNNLTGSVKAACEKFNLEFKERTARSYPKGSVINDYNRIIPSK